MRLFFLEGREGQGGGKGTCLERTVQGNIFFTRRGGGEEEKSSNNLMRKTPIKRGGKAP